MNTSLNKSPMGTRYFVNACLVMMLSLSSISAWASATVSERVDFSRAMPEENVEDMSVKVLGGSISVNRFYRVMKRNVNESGYPGVSGDLQGYKGNSLVSEATQFARGGAKRNDFAVWQFHRKWHDLLFVESNISRSTSGGSSSDNSTVTAPSEGGATLGDQPAPNYIDRNDYLYELQRGENYYTYEHNGNDLRITITDSGFRWSNRQGDWIDYDEQGLALRSGDKNGVSISLVRQNGFITEYKDHLGQTAVTWEYQNNKPVKATDYGGRVIEYKWDGHDLIEVTTTRGHKWKYAYTQIGDNRLMTSKTDPLNQTFIYEFEQTKGGYQSTSASDTGTAGVTLIGDDTPVAISSGSAGGSTTGYSVPVEPTMMHTAMIYPDGKRVRYQYRYDPASESYMILTINSDGLEEEKWYDLDGNIRYQLDGGKVAGVRIRSGRDIVSRDAYDNKTVTKITRFEAIESVTYPDGSTVSYKYLPNYNLPTIVTDQLGVKTKHQYDDNGNRVKSIVGFSTDDTRTTEYQYDKYGQLVLKRTVGGANTGGSITANREIKFEYDDYGNLTKFTDANGNVNLFKNYTANGSVGTVVDGRGNLQNYDYDTHGNLTLTTTALGYKSENQYDSLHRLIRKTDADGRSTEFEYDARNYIIKVNDNAGGVRESRFRLDGQPISVKDESGLTTTYEYDRAGRLLEQIDGVGNKTITRYVKQAELSGRLIESIQTPNIKTALKYDELNRVISRAELSAKTNDLVRVTKKTYTLRGNLKTDTDPNGNITSYVYNKYSEIIENTDAKGDTIFIDYDHHGNITSITDALGYETEYEYDLNNNRISETRAFGGLAVDRVKQRRAYDSVNNLVRTIDYLGNVTNYIYDKENRKVEINNTSADEPVKDGSKADRVIRFGHYKTGLLKNYNDGTITVGYEHDELGRLIKQTSTFTPISGQEGSISFTKILRNQYYPNSQLKARIDAEGNTTSFFYDAAGRLSKIGVQNSGSIIYNSYEGALPTRLTYPGGVTRELTYDGLSRLNRISVINNAKNTVMDVSYLFDFKDNIVERDVVVEGSQARSSQYGYDATDRLTSTKHPDSFGEQEYIYDANGNRTQLTRTNGTEIVIEKYVYSDYQELLGLENSADNLYDANGALLSDGVRNKALTYNSYGHLKRLTVTENNVLSHTDYLYDGMNRRIVKKVNDEVTVFLYDDSGQGLVAEYSDSGDLIRGYGYLPITGPTTNPLYMKYNESSEVQFAFYQNDHIGTPQQLIKASGEVVWQAEYDAFGKTTIGVALANQPLRFPGQYHDDESGYAYNWNRYYDPETGRYITSDPIGLAGGMNNYLYSEANPIVEFDPNGLTSIRDDVHQKTKEKLKNLPPKKWVNPFRPSTGTPGLGPIKPKGGTPSSGPTPNSPSGGADDRGELLGLAICAGVSALHIYLKENKAKKKIIDFDRGLLPCETGCSKFCVEYQKQYGFALFTPWCISDIYSGVTRGSCGNLSFATAIHGNFNYYKVRCRTSRHVGGGMCCG